MESNDFINEYNFKDLNNDQLRSIILYCSSLIEENNKQYNFLRKRGRPELKLNEEEKKMYKRAYMREYMRRRNEAINKLLVQD